MMSKNSLPIFSSNRSFPALDTSQRSSAGSANLSLSQPNSGRKITYIRGTGSIVNTTSSAELEAKEIAKKPDLDESTPLPARSFHNP